MGNLEEQFVWSLEDGCARYFGPHDHLETCLRDALGAADSLEGYKTVIRIGRPEKVCLSNYVPTGDQLLTLISESIWDLEHEAVHETLSDNIREVSDDSLAELTERLQTLISEWATENVPESRAFKVNDIREYTFTHEEIVSFQDEGDLPEFESWSNKPTEEL